MTKDMGPATVLQLVTDGKLTLLHRPLWLEGQKLDDLHAANAGCFNAAQRLAPVLAHGWTWRVGYDNLAELAWHEDPSVIIRVISLSPAHALLIGVLQALVMGPDGVRNARGGQMAGAVVDRGDGDRKIGD